MTTQKISRFHRAALALVLPVAVIAAVAGCDGSAAPKAAPAASSVAAVPSTSTNPAGPASAAPAAGLHMIANNGHQLAFHVTPGSSPTIVLDAGGGEDLAALSGIDAYGVLVQHPGTSGGIRDLRPIVEQVHDQGGLAIATHPMAPLTPSLGRRTLLQLHHDPDPRHHLDAAAGRLLLLDLEVDLFSEDRDAARCLNAAGYRILIPLVDSSFSP